MVLPAAGRAAMVLPAVSESSNGPTAGRQSGKGSVTVVDAVAMIRQEWQWSCKLVVRESGDVLQTGGRREAPMVTNDGHSILTASILSIFRQASLHWKMFIAPLPRELVSNLENLHYSTGD